MNTPALLTPWADLGLFGPAEAQVVDLLGRRFGTNETLTLFAAALLVRSQQNGHACVDLTRLDHLVHALLGEDAGDADLSALPRADDIRTALLTDPTVVRPVDAAGFESAADATDSEQPLVLCGDLLYSQRQWADERMVVERLHELAGASTISCQPDPTVLQRQLPADGESRQHLAGRMVADNPVSVLVGGPGTGKTFTTVRLLAAFAADPGTRIAVVAPTGKAANRTLEAITEARRDDADGVLPDRLAELAPSTIHRLLGHRAPKFTRFRHNAEQPLPVDVVVVDETSMVPLQLMARLLEAIPNGARLVLVGDPDQLESVGVGSALRDIATAAAADSGPLAGCCTRLETVRRQERRSSIPELAEAVRTGEADHLLEMLEGGRTDVSWIPTEDPTTSREQLLERISGPLRDARRAVADAGDQAAEHALDLLASARLLCGHWRGDHGVHTWNQLFAQALGDGHEDWPVGRPILVTANDPRTGLVNGDNGIVLRGTDGPEVAFRRPEGLERVPVVRLPPTLPAYALTVHRSQGSEYRHIALIVPPDPSPLLTRELLYTAVTRAKESLVVVGTEAAIRRAVSTRSSRSSGLADALTVGRPEAG